MKWFFTPAENDPPPHRHDDDGMPGQIGLPPALLQRHGARVLDPGKAALVSDRQPSDPSQPAPPPRPPRPTVYRASTLLIPDSVLRDDEFRTTIEEVLNSIGIDLKAPAREHRTRLFDEVPQLPHTTVLTPLPGFPSPVLVDAWTALQTLRADGIARKRPDQYREAVEQITLEHLMVSSAITGSPATEGGGGIAGGPGGGAVSGPGATDSYLFSGADPRTPVAVLLDPPERKKPGQCEADYGRRPVVTVLDTGVRAHPWLDVTADGAGGYSMPADGFVAVDDGIQAAIRAEGEHARATGDHSRQMIWNAWDRPVAADPLIGEFNPALGHSTFIAGIVRQVAPDARVLALRVLHSDDVAYEGDILCALRHLIERIELAAPGDLAGMTDVVSLSFGYFSESPHDAVLTSGLGLLIKKLLDLGVVVVAAAGNFATRRRFYPAAFAAQPTAADPVPVISVGALNPNGTKAMFSDDGAWVTAWARGAAVVSAYPVDIDASRTPELRVPANRKPPGTLPPGREALDPDDYRGGCAIWSGTSFSAPYLAALVARSLLAGAAAPGDGLRLDRPSTPARRERATAALTRLRAEESRLLRVERHGEAQHDG